MVDEKQNQEIYKLITDGELFEVRSKFFGHVNDLDQVEFIAWRYQVISQLKLFGSPFSDLVARIEDEKQQDCYTLASVRDILGALKAANKILETQKSINPCIKTASSKKLHFNESKVFIVHGHDSGLLHSVARFINSFNIEPIILQEQTGNGQTIIEKLEINSDVNFAIVLLTPDDLGKAMSGKELKHRARQNVILELGFFFGKLGRTNVRALYDEKVELPSDLIGTEYIKIDNSDGWKLKLAKEMQQSGLKIDMNKIN
jgi:predicted nucleotide-binding protein